MYRIRKMFKFEAAHMLASSYSKCCQQLHGHSYKLEVFLTSSKLNNDGMVIDFGELKNQLAGFFDLIDHACFLPRSKKKMFRFPPQGHIFLCKDIPTAENMAEEFFHVIKLGLKLKKGIKLEKVRVHETDTGYAEYWK